MRPRTYDDPETLDMMVDMYVMDAAEKGEFLTLPGLALFLGWESKDRIYQYEEDERFQASIKRARSIVETKTVNVAMSTSGGGPVFILKNMGYTDRFDIKHTPINIKIEGDYAKL